MAFLGKKYSCYKSENFNSFLKKVGVPEDKIEAFANAPSAQKFEKDGDTYKLITNTPDGEKEISFKSGVQFDDVIGPKKTPIKNTLVVDGNTVTQTITADGKSAVFKREFNGDELVVTITADEWDGVAKRFYKV